MGFIKAREDNSVPFLPFVPGRNPSKNIKYFLGSFFLTETEPAALIRVPGSFCLHRNPVAGHIQN